MAPSEDLELKIYQFADHHGKGQWQVATLPALYEYCGKVQEAVLVDALHDLHSRGFIELRQWRQPVGWIDYGAERVYFNREFQLRVTFPGRKYFEVLEQRGNTESRTIRPSTELLKDMAEPVGPLSPQSQHPKAFVSHSSQDHNFVLKFSADLRAKGVDAWYAEWEIKPGDSIRAKIDEGLEGCEFFIIVLSKSSIARPWVQTELDGATIRKLNGKVRKIIPVKIEDCGDLPPTLASLLWEDFSTKPYEAALKRILDSIFDVDIRPPLGQASQPGSVPNLKRAETAPKPKPEDASNRSTLVLFFLGVAASLLPAGLQLIGITVNLWVGSAMILTALVLAALAFWWASGSSRWRIFLRCLIVAVMLGSLYLTFYQVHRQYENGQASSQATGSPQTTNRAASPNGATNPSRSQQLSGNRSTPISGSDGAAKGRRSLDSPKADQMPSLSPNSESKLDNTVQKPNLGPPATVSGNPVTAHPADKPSVQPLTPEQQAATPTVPIPRAGRQRGTVKWFNAAKGYGSITTEEGADIFVHFSAITEPGYRTLDENAKVEFTLVRGPKGSQAENVRLVK